MKQPRVSTVTAKFFSRLNNRYLPYSVVLPPRYEEKSIEKFPVLYLLHGLFGHFDNWLTNTKLIEYAENFSFIIVCAEGGNSWYTDSTKIENHFFESYLIAELMPEIETNFRTRRERNFRAIAGLSMGGYGAFKLAFREPELFALAASMSGAFHVAEICENQNSPDWLEIQPSILKIFGRENHEVRQKNDLFYLANAFPPEEISRLPFFYFDCGSADSFLPLNIKFAKILQHRNIAFEFHAHFGGHDWDYWNRRLLPLLYATSSAFNI